MNCAVTFITALKYRRGYGRFNDVIKLNLVH